MPRMTHAQLIEATRLKLIELEEKALEKEQKEKETDLEKLDSLIKLHDKRATAHQEKIDKLNATYTEASSKLEAKITELRIKIGDVPLVNVTKHDSVGV